MFEEIQNRPGILSLQSSIKNLFLTIALFAACAFFFRLFALEKPPRGPLGPMVSQMDGLELLKRIATPVRWTHFSPVSDGGSSIYRFKDAHGQILVLFWDNGFSEANHIHLAVMDKSSDTNPYEGPDSASFDCENNTDIATELHRLLQSAATEPMPTDDLNTFSDTDFQRFLKHLIRKVNLMGNLQPE